MNRLTRETGSLLLLSAALCASAQTSEQFKESPAELAAKEVVMKWDRLKGEGKAVEAVECCIAVGFKEHIGRARQATNGKSDYENMMEMAKRQVAAGPRPARALPAGITLIPSQTRASEDMVTLFHSYGCDIFRVKDGKMTDHYDCTPWEPFSTIGENKLLQGMTQGAPRPPASETK